MADEPINWKWDTSDAVDVEVKRGFIKSRKIFKKYSKTLREDSLKSSLCENCNQACMLCELVNPSSREGSVPDSKWTKTKESFKKSAAAPGCHLCIMIAHAFDTQSVDTFGKLDNMTEIHLHFSYRSSVRDPDGKLTWEQRNGIHLGNLTIEEDDPDEFWLRICSGKKSALSLQIDLRMEPLFRSFDNVDMISTSPIRHYSTGCSQNIELASSWLQVCEEAHPMCNAFRPPKSNWCPSRLIDVGNSLGSKIKLVISSENLGPVAYCALSYCWGTDQAIVLTQENIVAYQKELPFNKLPATIRDAITLTRTLGYSYLWVDALCIVQGSKSDWEMQSPQMSNVYGLAALTIAAAGSPSVTNPMFQRRDPRKVRPCVISIRPGAGRYASKYSNRWIVYPNQPERMVTAAFNENPLSRRGWTLQERILSPRLLMFGEQQMLWSCVTMEACETFPSGLDPRFSTPISELRNLANLRQRLMRLCYLGALPSEFWHDIVQLYSTADLTVSSDKLVAIQGVVTRLEEISRAITGRQNKIQGTNHGSYQYVGGLWRDKNFRQSLLWRTNLDSNRSRPKIYRAPSWSWAAVDAEIIPYEEYLPWTWNTSRDLATVLDTKVGLVQSEKSATLTGQLESGYVNLECYCRPCYLMRNEKSHKEFNSVKSDAKIITAQSLLDMGLGRVNGDSFTERARPAFGTHCRQNWITAKLKIDNFSKICTLDCPDDLPLFHWIEVYCVPLQLVAIETDRYELSRWESYEGLVLVPTTESYSIPGASLSGRNSKDHACKVCSCKISTAGYRNFHKLTTRGAEKLGKRVDLPNGLLNTSIANNGPLSGGHSNGTPSATCTFRRIGVFRYDIDIINRASREDELFGPRIDTAISVNKNRKEISVRSESTRKRDIITIV